MKKDKTRRTDNAQRDERSTQFLLLRLRLPRVVLINNIRLRVLPIDVKTRFCGSTTRRSLASSLAS